MTIIRRENLRSRKRYASIERNSLIAKLLFFAFGIAFTAFLFTNHSGTSSGRIRSGVNKLQSLVRKYETSGYGPTHPRAAFILVATTDLSNPIESMVSSIESIFRQTDRNRIFSICAVFQSGVLKDEQKAEVQLKLESIDSGTTDHWHGLTRHVHGINDPSHSHETKVRVIHHDSKSVSASRREAVGYVEILANTMERMETKKPDEDIIVVFVRPDSSIETKQWIDIATHALIDDTSNSIHTDSSGNVINARKMSNAVSFAASPSGVVEQGETKSVNLKMMPVKTHASQQDLKLTNGQTYPSPVLEGAVTAMKLSTYLKFPVVDETLSSYFASDLEMSFNLWMCADGIDIISSLRAKTTLGKIQHRDKAAVSDDNAARLAQTWMKDSEAGRIVLDFVKDNGFDATRLSQYGEGSTLVNAAKKCRSFEWYIKEVNVLMGAEIRKLQQKQIKKAVVVDTDFALSGFDLERPNDGTVPSKPLSEVNKQIISSAKMIDLAFLDVSNGHKEHPHMGAMDEHGAFGYVHDPTYLKKNPHDFKYTPEEIECSKNDGNKKMLTQKVFVDLAGHQAAERLAETEHRPRAKIFCLVYTVAESHDRIESILETWGGKCDGFMVGSTKTDRELGTVNIPHEGEYHIMFSVFLSS